MFIDFMTFNLFFLRKNAPKWDKTNLAVGNWFSGTRYFQAKSASGNEVVCNS